MTDKQGSDNDDFDDIPQDPREFFQKLFGQSSSSPMGGMSFGPFTFPGPGDDSNPSSANGADGFRQFMSEMQSMMFSFMDAQSGKDLPSFYEKLAKQSVDHHLFADARPTSAQKNAVSDVVSLTDLWLNDATALPSAIVRTEAWDQRQWAHAQLEAWSSLFSELLDGVKMASQDAFPKEIDIPVPGISVDNLIAATAAYTNRSASKEIGNEVAEQADMALISSEFCLPLTTVGTAAIIPRTLYSVAKMLRIEARDLMVYLAARECAYHRLWKHSPWVKTLLHGAVKDFASSLTMEFPVVDVNNLNPEELQNMLGGQPNEMMDSLSEHVQALSLSPQVSSTNSQAQDRLGLLLGLMDSWVDVVVEDSLKDRIPSMKEVSAQWRTWFDYQHDNDMVRHTPFNLAMVPLFTDEARELWRRVTDACGMEKRDSVWDHPDLLPQMEHMENPASFIDRLLDDSDDFEKDFALLEQMLQSESDKVNQDDSSGEEKNDDGDENPAA